MPEPSGRRAFPSPIPQKQAASLEGDRLCARRGHATLFAEVSFGVGDGAALVVTGPNGSGKTTLLRMLAGLTAPAAGAIRWRGSVAFPFDASLRAAVAFSGHLPALKDELTAEEMAGLTIEGGLPAVEDEGPPSPARAIPAPTVPKPKPAEAAPQTDPMELVEAGRYEPGEVVTKPFTFSGKELVLNYATSAAGSVQVEIQDPAGKPIEGYTLDGGKVLFGDEIAGPYSWKSGSDVSKLAGKPVRLRFVLKDADLYSYRFAE